MTDKATPRPWKAVGAYIHGKDVLIAQFGNMADKELVPFNSYRWKADCDLAVRAVNSFDEREALRALLREAADNLERWAVDPSCDCEICGQAVAFIARIRTALGETPALPDTGEKN